MHPFVDMARTPVEIENVQTLGYGTPTQQDGPIYPYGLCICLGQEELDKLDLDGECEIGDVLHMHCFAKVTSVSKNANAGGSSIRIELQITHISAEDESEEDEEAEQEMGKAYKAKNPYKK